MIVLWLSLLAVSAAVEAATCALVGIWFAAGALAALLGAALGGAVWLQGVLFLAAAVAAAGFCLRLKRRRPGRDSAPDMAGETAVMPEAGSPQTLEQTEQGESGSRY